jgi:hypothetical protein
VFLARHAGRKQDGNGDGARNPQNALDAALTAAVYLCSDGPRNLADANQLRAAIFRYNASQTYVDKVITNLRAYDALTRQPGQRVPANAHGAANKVIDAAMAQRGVPQVRRTHGSIELSYVIMVRTEVARASQRSTGYRIKPATEVGSGPFGLWCGSVDSL